MSRKKLAISETFPGLPGRIKQIRKKFGSQEKFGKLLGVRKATISRYESERIPDADTLKKIADYGGVTVEWLLHGDKKEETPDFPEAITIESPQSGPLLHEPYLFNGIDIDAMSQIIEAVEQLLGQRRKPLKPMKKALLISLLYDEFQKSGRPPDQVTLKEFLRRVD